MTTITRRRRPVLIAALAIGLAIVAGVVVAVLPRPSAVPLAAANTVSTAAVTSGDMVAETRMQGVIAYSATTAISSGLAGVITELPAPGASIAAGGVLYRVDTMPVILLTGSAPAWRDFTSGMSDGQDVLQLEENLAAFGFFAEVPDASFDWDTVLAIRDWQSALGLERTGTVERSMVVFWNGSLRVDAMTANLGQGVGPGSPLYQATSTEKVVSVAVSSSDRALAGSGQSVTVTLPDGSSTAGLIQSVGEPVSRPDPEGGPSTVVIPVRVSIADQDAILDLALATVTVSFASALRDDVLTVPVDALVPLDDTHYAVELPPTGKAERGELVPVTTGAVASGRVEISGNRIVAGLLVVVPTR